jgi:hypothetical protein
MLEFRALDPIGVNVTGAIQPDGKFSLYTLADERKIDGAPEGKYEVTVMLPAKDQKSEFRILPDPYLVKPEENHFVIILEPAGER